MTSEILIGSRQPPRLEDFGVGRLIDVVTASTGDHGQPNSGNDGHRVAPGVGGGGPNDFQPLRVVLWSVREAGKIAIAIAARSMRGPWAPIQISGHLPRGGRSNSAFRSGK